MRNWLSRRLVEPLLALLRQGVSPQRLALCVAIAIVVGNIPILGVSTIICGLIALVFRLVARSSGSAERDLPRGAGLGAAGAPLHLSTAAFADAGVRAHGGATQTSARGYAENLVRLHSSGCFVLASMRAAIPFDLQRRVLDLKTALQIRRE
jgi:hypothetical protein